ncbi:MAG TPA: rhamnan synthesis F family protein [Rhizobium sp.]|nr:rhamnan synthesis F family protein [Rhizobium sp.]
MIPKWKLKRELLRIWYKIVDLPGRLMSLPDRLAHKRRLEVHDRDFDRIVQSQPGAVARQEKVVIFLVYQPKGVPPSVYLTLNYLIRNGYAPLIVMNSPILPQDAKRLLASSWLLVTRPNFGYDFGGYRDGLRILGQHGPTPDRLLIMNDSVWFPMQGDPLPMLETRLDAGGLDAVGLNQDQKVRYHKDGTHHYELRHLESYFFLLSHACIESSAFRSFWADYRMSSNKPYTIKHGEMGFSKHMMRHGAQFDGVLQRSRFVEAIESCSAGFLRTTLEYAAYADDDYRKERDDLLSKYEDSEAWRQEVLAHLRKNALRRPFNTSFCYAADQLFGTIYLKKNSQTYFHEMRQNYLRAVQDGKIPAPAPDVLAEIAQMVADHDPAKAERTL